MSKVYLKPIAAQSWSGVINYPFCKVKIAPSLLKSGVLNTGLTHLTEEELRKFEKELKLSSGDLDNNSELWKNYFVSVDAYGIELDTSIPEHKLQYYMVKAQGIVANGQDELSSNPNAEFILTNDEEEAEKSNGARNIKKNAFLEFAKMSKEDHVNAMTLLSTYSRDSLESLQASTLEDKLGEIVESKPKKFLAIIGDPDYKLKILLTKALQNGIIVKSGGGIRAPFYYGDTLLGHSIEESAEYVSSVQEIRIAIEKQYQMETKK